MNIKDVLTITDTAEFLRQSEEFLRGDFDVDEFRTLFQKLVSIDVRHATSGAQLDCSAVCELTRELLFQLTIDAGNLPEVADLVAFNLFVNAKNLGSHPKAVATISSLQGVFETDGISELEKVYMAILEFYLGILDGRAEEAFGIFIRRLSVVHLHEAIPVINSDVLVSFFTAIDVQPKQFVVVLGLLFEPQFYFSLVPYQRRSIFDWILHSFWQYQPLFSHAGWPGFYEQWKALLYEHIAKDQCDEVMYLQFFIYHVMGNSYQTQLEWREFNESISRKTSAYYMDWARRNNIKECKKEQKNEGKKLIAFLRDRFVGNSPFKVEYSVLKNMISDKEFTDKYDVVAYNMDYIEKSDSDDVIIKMYADLGIPVVNVANHLHTEGFYYSHLQKALLIRDRMINDDVDIMVAGSGAYDINDFLLSVRTAPKQIVWIHGNFEYDVSGIDKRITHISENTHMKCSEYSVEHFDYQTDELFTRPEEEQYKAIAKAVRSKYPIDAVILGAIGRLVKVDSEQYIEAISEIMKRCPNTIYLACGGGNTEGIKEKLIKYNIDESRFIFEGFVDPHIYGYVIDVYLNTFPEGSGESLNEFMAKGPDKYVVSLAAE